MTEELVRLPVARRISFQPIMAVGLTGTELIAVIACGFAVMLAAILITLPVFRALHVSLLSGGLLGFAGAFVLRAEIIRSKRQAPEGYVEQRFLRLRLPFGGVPGLIGQHGTWDPQRHGPPA